MPLRVFFRIYPTYVVGFTMTFAFVFLYTRYRGVAFPYSVSEYLAQISLFRDWFWSRSIDGVSWTLETEIKFYTLLFILACFKKMNSARALVLTAFLLCICNVLLRDQHPVLLKKNLPMYKIASVVTTSTISLIFMMLGVCFYNFHKKYWSLQKFLITLALMYHCFVLAFMCGPNAALKPLYTYTYGYALFAFGCAYMGRDLLRYNRVLNFMADISYPVYVIHGLNGYLLMSVLEKLKVEPHVSILIATAASVLLAYCLHRLVEMPSIALGKMISKKIKVVQVALAQPVQETEPTQKTEEIS